MFCQNEYIHQTFAKTPHLSFVIRVSPTVDTGDFDIHQIPPQTFVKNTHPTARKSSRIFKFKPYFFHSNYLKPSIFPKSTIQNLAIYPENSPTAAQQKLRARHGTKNFGPGQNVTN
jgi:hypothetical protein